jgi:hypothetical protein
MPAVNPLLFYVDPAWRRKGPHTPLLNPWWGNPVGESSLFTKQLFDTYTFDTTFYGMTEDVQKADLVLAPYRHQWVLLNDPALLRECSERARAANVPLLIDGSGDIDVPVNIEHVCVLRTGGYRFLPEKDQITVPFLADDLLERCREGHFQPRKKKSGPPVVGFAGWVALPPLQVLRTAVKELPARLRGLFDPRYRACTKGVFWRQRAIKALKGSKDVVLNLRARDSFSASAKTAHGDLVTLREEMVDTILESDYALDVRGDANNSTRLFEILSLGRIPVIVDTERNFPFGDEIDYTSFALTVDFRDLNNLPNIIADFHKSILPERFEQMQKNARDAYVRYFRIDAIIPILVQELRRAIASDGEVTARRAKTI